MVQIIQENKKPSTSQNIGQLLSGLGNVAADVGSQYMNMQQQARSNQQLNELTGMNLSGLPPKLQEIALAEALRSQGKERLMGQKQDLLGQIFGQGSQNRQRSVSQQLQGSQDQTRSQSAQSPSESMFDASELTDSQIAQATALDPNLGRVLQHEKDVALRERRGERKFEQSKFESERSFHTGLSKDAEKEAAQLRSALPRKEMALDFARNAVETGDLSYFSPDKLADATGIDLFRTAKGSQLVTAAKENLLGNMGRVSARGQNLWFEQRLNSMFPKIGQSREANLTAQEMIEGEAEMERAYLNEFDRLSSQDEEKYGFTRKDIQKRAQDAVKPIQKQIFQRSSYRMKEIEEQEKGLTSLKKTVGKNVIKGTPLTLAMAKLYKDKFGDNALDVAKKNGYYIPTLEEFKTFQARPQEFREQIAP